MRRIAVIALVLVAGCGGDGTPKPLSAAEWRERTDSVCARATDAIAKGGWVDDLDDLYRRMPGAVREAQSAIDEIRALPLPQDDTFARSFANDLRDIAPLLDDLVDAGETPEMHALTNASARVEPKLRALQETAKLAGLRRCFRAEIPWVVIDELRAPVAAERFARLQVELEHRVRRGTGSDWLKTMVHMTVALRAHEDGLSSIRPPLWANEEMATYRSEVRDFRLDLEALLRSARLGGSRSRAQFADLAERGGERLYRRCTEVWEKMGAEPVTRPDASS
jgi:hypothetical protein